MGAREELVEHRPWGLLVTTGLFLVVYVCIHIFLNITANGTRPIASLAGFLSEIKALSWIELSGPFTIGLCTSLLLLSFGMFLHHGIGTISLGVPGAFLNAFIILIISLTLVQMSGHAEIYANACADTPTCAKSKSLGWIAQLSYLFSLIGLVWLESYSGKNFRVLAQQISEGHRSLSKNTSYMASISVLSLVITVIKVILGVAATSPEMKDGITAMAIALEVLLAVVVVYFYFFQSADQE